MILVRLSKPFRRLDGSTFALNSNSGILIKKKQNIKSKYIQGITTYNMKRKKFKSVFRSVL